MDLASNPAQVRERIAAACARANRDPSSVTLLAVTKTQPPEVVSEAARLGLNLFGENKVQEARSKIPLEKGSAGLVLGRQSVQRGAVGADAPEAWRPLWT
jgi:uncharacterized pyridoxal phosphate-containing UPF0001 family protein